MPGLVENVLQKKLFHRSLLAVFALSWVQLPPDSIEHTPSTVPILEGQNVDSVTLMNSL